MKHGSLFSGIGGFDLASEWMGWQNVFHCEINPFGSRILKHYWPQSISYNDITKTDFTIHRGNVDIISGGFPCQPFSVAGERKGTDDTRYLWPEMLRVIREVCPKWVVGENVYGLVNWNEGMVFDKVCADLENEGFKVIPIILPAASVDAPHKRDRIYFVAYSNNKGGLCGSGSISKENEELSEWDKDSKLGNTSKYNATNSELFRLQHSKEAGDISKSKTEMEGERSESSGTTKADGGKRDTTNTNSTLLEYGNGEGKDGWNKQEVRAKSFSGPGSWEAFPTQSPVCSRDDGIPFKLDGITFSRWRSESIKGYGNAIVPHIAFNIFKTIAILQNEKG